MSKGELCTIVKEYRPPSQRKHRELDLKVGDELVVVARDKEWWWGIRVRDLAAGVASAAFGWFPAEHGALRHPTAAVAIAPALAAVKERGTLTASTPPSSDAMGTHTHARHQPTSRCSLVS
jgi:hypothetical protein